MRVGLPDTVRYRRYGPFWEAFLKELGAVVVKPERSKADALEAGARTMPREAPTVQLLTGRVLELTNIVDEMIIPDLNPGAEPGNRFGAADPWLVDLPAVLSRRLSLPPVASVPARLGEQETSAVAVRVGHGISRNPQLLRRALDRTENLLRAPEPGEPRWQLAGHRTVAVVGEVTLLEEPFLWEDLPPALEAASLHPVYGVDLPRERVLDFGRRSRADLELETDLEVAGAMHLMEGRGPVRGTVFLTQPRSLAARALVDDLRSQTHKPALVVTAGDPDLREQLVAFAQLL